jgi:hypothetical protein
MRSPGNVLSKEYIKVLLTLHIDIENNLRITGSSHVLIKVCDISNNFKQLITFKAAEFILC